jgi:hypothetical protein
MRNKIIGHLDLMGSQRESTFSVLCELTDSQLCHRSLPKEWRISEILDHNNTLRIGIYHDQLRYEDAVKQARQFKG